VFQAPRIVCALGGLGKAQFGIQTQLLLSHFQGIARVLCVGAAGALSAEVRVFDVVVADATVEHDFHVRFTNRPQPLFKGDAGLLSRLRMAPSAGFAVHFGLIASGDEDVACSVRGTELRNRTGALAVAWEGAGGARAAALNGIPFAEVRGITDVVGTPAIDFRANIKIACANATNLICVSLAK
jgi:adenosylhomocysteine nucleosidase